MDGGRTWGLGRGLVRGYLATLCVLAGLSALLLLFVGCGGVAGVKFFLLALLYCGKGSGRVGGGTERRLLFQDRIDNRRARVVKLVVI